ncbi:hypothetical protein LTR17_000299 [Elasticomyces elasticus]|nr:hypothetical protein LTR17_000299 [Elasticomyces elasticus]
MFMYWETPTPAGSWNAEESGDSPRHTEGYIATNLTSPGPELERLSVAILEALYLRDYSNPVLRYFSSTYRASMETDTSSPSNTRSARAMRSDSISGQDFNHCVVNTTSEVDDGKGRANVLVTHRGTCFPLDDLAREYVTLLKWERGTAGWVCLGDSSLPGGGMPWVNISALAFDREGTFEPSKA